MNKQTFDFIPAFSSYDIVNYAINNGLMLKQVFKIIHDETNFDKIIEYTYDQDCSQILEWNKEKEEYESESIREWRSHCELQNRKKGA